MKLCDEVTIIILIFVGVVLAQVAANIPTTRFSCKGRPSGYYADIETGCQVYHMCDSIGRQFTYSCPNTTLFQQRMLVCDHWYMVNCSKAEQDYDANLLIGQRDKPFVTEYESHQRTPRPDILSIPLTPDFFLNLKDYKSQYPISGHISNSIISNDETDSSGNEDLSEHRFNIPTRWSTDYSTLDKLSTTVKPTVLDNNLKTASSTYPRILMPRKKSNKIPPNNIHVSPVGESGHKQQNEYKTATQSSTTQKIANEIRLPNRPKSSRPSHHISPVSKFDIKHSNKIHESSTTTVSSITSLNGEYSSNNPSYSTTISNNSDDSVVNIQFQKDEIQEQPSVIKFINQFIPDDDFNSTVRTVDEIISINKELPDTQISDDESFENATQVSRNKVDLSDVSFTEDNENKDPKSEHLSVNQNSDKTEGIQSSRRFFDAGNSGEENDEDNVIFKPPPRDLIPPKDSYSRIFSATKGPPIYYEWKWAVPAFDLEPPKVYVDNSNKTGMLSKNTTTLPINGIATENPKGSVTQRSLDGQTSISGTNDYEPSEYFIPKYVFPLDKPHPGYDENDSYTSFRVKIPHEYEEDEDKLPNYGENSSCPQCHPAFVIPGTCKPCVMIRQ